MEYTKQTVRSRPGLTQEQALASLQESPYFRAGTKIASIRPRGDRWVADIHIPKTAGEFPPSGADDGGDEAAPKPPKAEGAPDDGDGDDDSDSDSSDSEGGESPPGPPGGDKKPGEKGKGGADQQIVTLLTEILHALQGGPPMGGMGGPDDLGPGADGPPAPPPHGGPAGGPGGPGKMPMGGGAKLRPGEVPNKPGLLPVGAPAFSHTHQATMPPASPMAGGAGMTPGPTGGAGSCPTCGGPLGPDGTCPTCGQGGGGGMGAPMGAPGAGMTGYASLESKIASVAGKVPTITVSAQANMSIKEAKAQLEAVAGPYGYKVKQIKRVDGRPRALLSVR